MKEIIEKLSDMFQKLKLHLDLLAEDKRWFLLRIKRKSNHVLDAQARVQENQPRIGLRNPTTVHLTILLCQRYGIISDIHGNAHALLAVYEKLGELRRRSYYLPR